MAIVQQDESHASECHGNGESGSTICQLALNPALDGWKHVLALS